MFYAHGYEKGAKQSRLALWQEIQRRTGKPISWIDDRPICPNELAYVWDIYLSIRKGAETVDYNALNSYVNLTGDRLNSNEINLLLDVEYIRRNDD